MDVDPHYEDNMSYFGKIKHWFCSWPDILWSRPVLTIFWPH